MDLYAAPPDPTRPVICLDEHGYALQAEVMPALPAAPGQTARYDYTYARAGSCTVAVAIDRHRGWRHVWVQEQRRAVDFANWVRDLCEIHYPDADQVQLVVDNLSTHTPAALYAAFSPEIARRLAQKVTFHYTPKHGSWLNLVELELSVLARQCLRRRLASVEEVRQEVSAWADARNAAGTTVDWRFTTDRARHALGRHYPPPAATDATSPDPALDPA